MADDTDRYANIQRLRKLIRLQPLRFVLSFFCIILALYQTGILLAALTVVSQLSGYGPFLPYYPDNPIYVVVGSFLIPLAIISLGLLSSTGNLYRGLVTFGVLLFGLFMFELTMGAVYLAVSNSLGKSVIEAFETNLNNYTEYSDPMDYIQTNLNCCGINDFTDWNSTLGYIPGSCCDSDSACGFADIINLNLLGCYAALQDLIDYFAYYLIIILGGLAILQVATMIITFFHARGLADLRRLASRCIEDDRTPEPETPEIQNPFGLKNGHQLPRVKHESSSAWNTDTHVPRMIHDHQTKQSTVVGVRESITSNPIYRDMNFSLNRIPRQNVASTAPHLPRAHRKFPVGF